MNRLLQFIHKVASFECYCPRHKRGCPGGDCDGCQNCLAGEARRILARSQAASEKRALYACKECCGAGRFPESASLGTTTCGHCNGTGRCLHCKRERLAPVTP